MSIATLFDHAVRVYRATTAEDALGDPVETWAAQGTAPTFNNARPDQTWSGVLQDRGPGEEQTSQRRWFLATGLTVAERDVLNVTAGPESGVQLRVLSVTKPTAPLSVHHIEVNVEVFEGDVAA